VDYFKEQQNKACSMRIFTLVTIAAAAATFVQSEGLPSSFSINNLTAQSSSQVSVKFAHSHELSWKRGKIAPDQLWDHYKGKGWDLKCKMEATDQGAGWLQEAIRDHPSAASK
jgi:hypothetical protein